MVNQFLLAEMDPLLSLKATCTEHKALGPSLHWTRAPLRAAFLIICAQRNVVSFEMNDSGVGHFHDA